MLFPDLGYAATIVVFYLAEENTAPRGYSYRRNGESHAEGAVCWGDGRSRAQWEDKLT